MVVRSHDQQKIIHGHGILPLMYVPCSSEVPIDHFDRKRIDIRQALHLYYYYPRAAYQHLSIAFGGYGIY